MDKQVEQSRTLTPGDIEAIRQAVFDHPDRLTKEEVYELRGFLSWWRQTKDAVGSAVVKLALGSVAAIVAIAAFLAQPWRQ